jgi:hypothetical protein
MTTDEIRKRLADRYMTDLMFREEAEQCAAEQDKLRARLESEIQHDPVLKYMLDHNLWLSREMWMLRTYGNHPPEPWTAEHESKVPAPFRLTQDGSE